MIAVVKIWHSFSFVVFSLAFTSPPLVLPLSFLASTHRLNLLTSPFPDRVIICDQIDFAVRNYYCYLFIIFFFSIH